MGNAALCTPSIISNNLTKILSNDGKLIIYPKGPLKAAEIMLENPGQFLCESSQLKVGQRIVGLCAEEELERGVLYFLLPMEMLYSVLTNEEMKGFSRKVSRGVKQVVASNFTKIFPEFCLFPLHHGSSGVKREIEDLSSQEVVVVEGNERYSRQRSWQPALDTIVENSPHA